ncbi:conserved hypothetical protein [Candida dubliniensis CD36]|uniref:Uncharacterized protein n=1 Tax=Candida dubliniensis (strain CD36 / ATCC MYA-646 / CBS 7987 / NCPF 3949 / NRRL Y-17841) TaxID=573826 RepID=B9WLP0_CANDC|nr:conserved hypothetical protein [Candida dubliniensis CD36]CAX40002.1 conserved hypothetical protein [Candida dubliniensis CD36]
MSERKKFSSRISSIFNYNSSNSIPTQSSIQKSGSHSRSTGTPKSAPSSSKTLGSLSPSPRPLSKPLLNTNNLRSNSSLVTSTSHNNNNSISVSSRTDTNRKKVSSKPSISTLESYPHSNSNNNNNNSNYDNSINKNPHLNDNIISPLQHHNEGSLNPNQYYQQSPQYLNPLLKSPDSLESGPSKPTSPNPSINNRLRRKPPSDLDSFDFGMYGENNDGSDNETKGGTFDSPKSGTGITNDIIADLESDIDNFLKASSESGKEISMVTRTNSSKHSSPFPSSSSDVADNSYINDLSISRSKPVMGLADIVNEDNQHNNKDFAEPSLSAPYPLDSPLITPVISPVESPQIIQNEFMPITSNDNDSPNLKSEFSSMGQTSLANPFSSPVASGTPSIVSPRRLRNFDSSTPVSPVASLISSTERNGGEISQYPVSSISRNASQNYTSSRTPSAVSRMHSARSPGYPQSQPSAQTQTPLSRTLTENSTAAPIALSKSYTQKTYTSNRSNPSQHRMSSSVGSIYSSNSYRNVNLAALKKTLKLKPGEGERSNYVLAIRRAAGTSYNESTRMKWKLPVGILPVDKSATKENSNGKYMRLAGNSLASSRKKTSGVELKHGHLKPRLLAAEIDEGDDSTAISLAKTPLTQSSVNLKATETNTNKTVSNENSLIRTTTDVSIVTGDTNSIVTTTTDTNTSGRGEGNGIKRNESIVSSNSSGSLSDKNFTNFGYYQHRSYKDDDEDIFADGVNRQATNEDGNETDDENNHINGYPKNSYMDINSIDHPEEEEEEDNERPRLVLANPDYDSDDSS